MSGTTRGAARAAKDHLRNTMVNLCQEDVTKWEDGSSILKQAFDQAGVSTLHDLYSLTDQDIDELAVYDASGNISDRVLLVQRRRIRCVIALFHEVSRHKGAPVAMPHWSLQAIGADHPLESCQTRIHGSRS